MYVIYIGCCTLQKYRKEIVMIDSIVHRYFLYYIYIEKYSIRVNAIVTCRLLPAGNLLFGRWKWSIPIGAIISFQFVCHRWKAQRLLMLFIFWRAFAPLMTYLTAYILYIYCIISPLKTSNLLDVSRTIGITYLDFFLKASRTCRPLSTEKIRSKRVCVMMQQKKGAILDLFKLQIMSTIWWSPTDDWFSHFARYVVLPVFYIWIS